LLFFRCPGAAKNKQIKEKNKTGQNEFFP